MTAESLRGLNPEELTALMAGDENIARMQMGSIQDIANRIEANKVREAQKIAAQQKLINDLEKFRIEQEGKAVMLETKFGHEKALELLKSRLKQAKTPEEMAKAQADLDAVKALKAEREARTKKIAKEQEILEKTGGVKPSDDIARQRLDLAKQAAQQKLALDQAKAFDFILDPETDINVAKQAAELENMKPNNKLVFYVDENRFSRDDIKSVPVPVGLLFNGKPATGNEIIMRAKAANMSVPDYINAITARR